MAELRPGERGGIVDVEGVLVGHDQRFDEHWATGADRKSVV